MLGAGASTINLQHGAASTTGNLITEQASVGGGNFTINDFLPSTDVMSLNPGVSVSSIHAAGGNTIATLSDGTTITFTGVTNTNDIFTHGTPLPDKAKGQLALHSDAYKRRPGQPGRRFVFGGFG